ncbi:D-isomer-specific 2-hydroxyacid dehydrogenase family protein [Talaromyces proteolyticus]|uniref:D-isomer-specific 2-hydroxyacid dehydrogenase family protein n=1 Tax=Talaromyces proteolyticus TaxID=1131652 RepID=A0AAD4KSV1_9EURO|nr:D-isomer-specific 2-hydroxyacid dehydrogenase family protein [Talaromyces proteolyticus]KAH8698567.1 D-isomer-specific 2-hydroxyacid dehydrogenase family protein [Talaromyces proteolyticus]
MSTATNHHIVVAQAEVFTSPLQFSAPPGINITQELYPNTTPDQVHERCRNATIIVLSYLRLDAIALSEAITPNLKFIAIAAVGTDSVDLEACRKRGIIVSNCPAANVESVSNHVMGMYFAARRNVIRMDRVVKDGNWFKNGHGPLVSGKMKDKNQELCLTCDEETVGILGYGSVGKKVAQLSKALGMKVLIAGRKGANGERTGTNIERTPFEEVLKQSTVLVVAVPRCPETMNLISTTEFQKMSCKAVLINISRGGIVDENALVQALKDRSIFGAATDVFGTEPASAENSPLLADGTTDLNLTTSPHLAWYADKTMENYLTTTPTNIRNFFLGSPTNLVV